MICVKKFMSDGSFDELLHQREPLVANRLEAVVGRLVGAAIGHAQIFERDRIEIVVGERDEAEAAAAQLDELLDHRVGFADARLLAVGAPHRAERAVLRAAAHGLHRRDHVLVARQQIPARLQHRAAFDLAAVVDALRRAGLAVVEHRPARRDRRRP